MASSRSKKKLVLLDAHAILHRAFHALPSFVSPKGEPTGALYGFAAFLLKILRELKPDYIAACYDLPEPTFRHAAYEKYKAKRPKMDESLAFQINRSRDILSAFGIPVYDSPGFEADDVLGTIVEQISRQPQSASQLKIIIASGDLDTLQLVKGDDVVVYTLSRGINEAVVYNEKKVKERFGFGPEMVTDYKALKGDPSDNIIGVPGIGDKTAKELIINFGRIENLYKKLKKDKKELEKKNIKPRIIKILEENEEEAEFSKSLAEINKSAPIKFSVDESALKKNFDIEKVKQIFLEFGFKSLFERLEPKDFKDESLGPTEPFKDSSLSKEKELFEKFRGEVPEKLFYEIELPLSKILSETQEKGILIDVKYLNKLSGEHHKKLKDLKKKIWLFAGEEFNVSSPQQLGKIIFEKLKLNNKKIKKTSTGAYSTNISELVKLKDEYPIINEIISYRELSKLVSTYIDTLPGMVDKDGRIHTTFNQAGTVTGRISSQNPNLQNIPVRTNLGKGVRRAFIAGKGFKLAAFDYSQIELRVAAILSKDKKLGEVFQKDEDVHSAVACEVFNVSPDKVTEEMRRRAKIINFGIIYGMGINALSKNLGCAREEAQMFYDEYFNDFNGVADYIERVKNFARERGYTETLFGRKRFFPEINSRFDYVRKEAERMATNAPIQGTAADFIKLAMVRADKILAEKKIKDRTFLLLQIHDELLYEIEEKTLNEAVPIIKEAMEGVYKNEVPLKVKILTGENWRDMVEFKI